MLILGAYVFSGGVDTPPEGTVSFIYRESVGLIIDLAKSSALS